MDEREKSLSWWKDLDIDFQKDLAKEHKPDWTFEMVDKSSSTIQKIFEVETKRPKGDMRYLIYKELFRNA